MAERRRPLTAPARTLFLYPGAARRLRIAEARSGRGPKEFFYGMLGLEARGMHVTIGDTHADPKTLMARARMTLEIQRNRIARVGWSRERVRALRDAFADTDVAVSFTDGFSMAMGLCANELPPHTRLVGGFMGLSDLMDRARRPLRGQVRRSLERAIAGLDHLFFFGEADCMRAQQIFGIDAARTSLFRFGVDTDFWSPDPAPPEDGGVLAVGSDPSRDYATLLAAPYDGAVTILTRLPVSIPPPRANVRIISGSLASGPVSDADLRAMYRSARTVVVPLHDAWQPSGQSVAMQAMACGRPVVLSRNRGLWSPEVLASGENCVLVPPGDPSALGNALRHLAGDEPLRRRLGAAARETAHRHFGLAQMDEAAAALVERSMSQPSCRARS